MKISLFSFLVLAALPFADAEAAKIRRVTGWGYDMQTQQESPSYSEIEHPAPPRGYRQVVLPIQDWENLFKNERGRIKVELRFRKMTRVDSCNSYSYDASLKTIPVPDAEYLNYLKVENLQGPSFTEMGCGDNNTHNELVGIGFQEGFTATLVDVDNVVVLHVPEGVEVDYRLWRASPFPGEPGEGGGR